MPLEFGGAAPAGGKTAIFTFGGADVTGTLREFGIFNDATAGTMLLRMVIPDDVSIDASEGFKIEIELAVRDL